MRLIDADALKKIKFHPLPYTHITPSDVDAESYKRGWNDAIDAIIENAPTIEPERKKGKWVDLRCRECGQVDMSKPNFCPNCGSYNGESEHGDE